MFSPKKSLLKKNEIPIIPLEACLAKTRKTKAGVLPGRTVGEHCEIAGAVARELLSRIHKAWAGANNILPENYMLAAKAHDVGKESPAFQKKLLAETGSIVAWPEFANAQINMLESQWGYHAGVSYSALKEFGASEQFARAVGAHHGHDLHDVKSDASDLLGGKAWSELRQSQLARLVGDCELPVIDSLTKKLLLIGLTVVSDWIASGEIFADPAQPWRPLIKPALDTAGFIFQQPVKGLSFEEIFGFSPNFCQKAMSGAVDGPGVYLLEAPMGVGKTEAALYAAYKLLEKNMASGLYFGLPTQLTSNKINERVEQFIARILPHAAAPVLAHGDAWLARHQKQQMGGEVSPAGQWFEQGKRAILAPYAVGTVDQALMSVIKVPWAGLRLFGLAGKVVILDEIHSYDAYTGKLLDNLVQNLIAMNSTVIILSATLTAARRFSIIRAAGANPGALEQAYPLLTIARPGQQEKSIAIPPAQSKTIKIGIAEDEDKALDAVIDRAEAGQQTVWIENTVRMAQEIFRKLASRSAGLPIEVGLMHSRFTMADRLDNEGQWTEILGKTGIAGSKSRSDCGRILIGTQVIEQSLDIDADFMVSRFAPTDLLLQRLGRLWRHDRPARNKTAAREAMLLAPSLALALANPEKAFADTGSSSVYSPHALARSLEVWTGRDKIILPDDIRSMIENTYREREEIPGTALARAQEAEAKEVGQKISLALQSMSTLGKMLDEEKAATRLVEMESVNVLVLRDIDLQAQTCKTLSGQIINLENPFDSGQRVAVAAQLAMQCVKTPAPAAPEPAGSAAQHLFKPFLREARADQLRVLLVAKSGLGADVSGKKLENISYDAKTGYCYRKPEG